MNKKLILARATSGSSETKPAAVVQNTGVTVEFQRQKAKEMVAFFQDKNFEKQLSESQVFGFTRKNEIGNGRYV